MSDTSISSLGDPFGIDGFPSLAPHRFTWSDQGELTLACAGPAGPLQDSLTGLGNRRYLDQCTERALLEGKAALILLDLDRFRAINDTFGRRFGDAILCLVAGRLQHAAQQPNVVARVGPDEFAVLSQDINAEALVGELDRALGEAFVINGQVANVRPRFGVAQANQPGATASDLMGHAELALYAAKNVERQNWRFFEPSMARRAAARQHADIELRSALEQGEFKLVYQPQISSETRHVTGLEALLRWHHPQRGVVPPAEFIARAEEVGAIVPMGAWVLSTACREAMTWPGLPRVAVNVSPVQFRDPGGLFTAVEQALATSGLPPERLELEITESIFLRKENDVLKTLHRLRGLGVTIAIDDFGTGYSSLSQLKDFPFDRIKIDRSFICILEDNSIAVAVVAAVAKLSASVGMTTTAEGVETEAQASIVQSNGCTEMQGYLFSRPVPGEEVLPWLTARHQAHLERLAQCTG